MKNFKLIAVCVLLFSITISAKTITGVITDNEGHPLPGVQVLVKETSKTTQSDFDGAYSIEVNLGNTLLFNYVGYESKEILVGNTNIISVVMNSSNEALDEMVVVGYGKAKKRDLTGSLAVVQNCELSSQIMGLQTISEYKNINRESYAIVAENGFCNPVTNPLSTFSIDVDAASYSNVRRFINNGSLPPKDAVRIEEMINYFDYSYEQPQKNEPFSINYELSSCPWNKENQLLHVGIQGKILDTKAAPASNLVFLIDVSGSMSSTNKLPLLKKAYALLVSQLREKDKVAIVVYAGASGVVLPSTSGAQKKKIIEAIENLQSGGGTAGAQGLELAYKIAEENFVEGGNNRIILATDGDFNVGISSDEAMENLIEEKRKTGIYISVAGFGMGNYKDSKMEIIADKGNGNYNYIDNILEAKKVFVNEFGGTLFTIAKDVKIQIEFNPNLVKRYRLVGYENRLLAAEDFQNDKKDAGELGAGHTVTALYEIVPVGNGKKWDTDLKYQEAITKKSQNQFSKELATVKFRYKKPESNKSKLIVKPISNKVMEFENTSIAFQFSSAVAGFGMLLKNGDYKEELTFLDIERIAKKAKGTDDNGYRAEFIRLVEMASLL